MSLIDDLFVFGNACEHLLANIASHEPPLPEPMRLFIRRYCQELLDKTSEPPTGQNKGTP